MALYHKSKLISRKKANKVKINKKIPCKINVLAWYFNYLFTDNFLITTSVTNISINAIGSTINTF